MLAGVVVVASVLVSGVARPVPRAVSTRPPVMPELDAIHEAAIQAGIAATEAGRPPAECTRVYVCIGDGESPAEIRERFTKSGIEVRACADRQEAIPVDCRRTIIRVVAPMTLDKPVTELRFVVEGDVKMRCINRVEPYTGTCPAAPNVRHYCPTNELLCNED
jgi:hypothetical protein